MPSSRAAAALLLTLAALPGPVRGQEAPLPAPRSVGADTPSDLDALMDRVLKNRDQAWRRLQEYLLAERETLRVEGPDGAPVFGTDREYVWVAREGRAVRSPVRFDGVAVGETERRRAEVRWQEEEDARAERAEKRAAEGSSARSDVEDAMKGREPRFISEVQFLKFRFEPGNYYFVEREALAGREVLRIEYYPRRLFAEEFDEGRRERERTRHEAERPGQPRREVSAGDDEAIERALNKVSLVTLWVDPAVDQVVRYTFDNVDFNFLPGRSLVRVDTVKATMAMGQPFPGVWLPESLALEGAITLATGTYRAAYARRFSDYRQADVQVRFRVKDDE